MGWLIGRKERKKQEKGNAMGASREKKEEILMEVKMTCPFPQVLEDLPLEIIIPTSFVNCSPLE